jgi:hypothetical protein
MIVAFLLALQAWSQTDPGIPDLTTRESARAWHNTWWPRTYGAAMGFTGDVGKGIPGDVSAEYRNQALLRYNMLRRMVGSPAFVLDDSRNQTAQLAAMVIAANNKMDHGIDASWKFYSDAANHATQVCLEALTYSEPGASLAYLYDFGVFNVGGVGHRRMIISPWVGTSIGIGQVAETSTNEAAETLMVTGPESAPVVISYVKPLVQWPVEGYVPNYLITGQWSVSIPNMLPADWNQTLSMLGVKISVWQNGVPVTVTGGTTGAGEAAVWTIDGSTDGMAQIGYITLSSGERIPASPNFEKDIVYHVRLEGVRYRVVPADYPGNKDFGGGMPYNGTGVIEYDVVGYNPDNPTTMAVVSAPVSQTVVAGNPVTLMVTATGVTAYQWYKDWEPISGATNCYLPVLNFQSENAGCYHCLMTGPDGCILSGYATLSLATAVPQRIVNLSTRSFVGINDQVQVGGFVIDGTQPKMVLIRAAGPALDSFHIIGALADPILSLFDGNQKLIASNDDWCSGATPGPAIEAVASQVGAFAFKQGSKDASLLVTLQPGHYTAQVAGKNGSTGIALVEVYDAAETKTTRLLNISSRTLVQSGDNNSQVAGFVISGEASKTVLIRAAGPVLAGYGVSGVLPDPILRLFDAKQQVIASNDDWSTDIVQASVIMQAAAKVGAFGFDSGSKDAALLVTLAPGLYSAQVIGQGTDSGVALVEVYEVP